MRAKLLNKSCIVVHHGKKSLNGLTTNVMEAKTTAFLDRFGKVIAYCDQHCEGDDVYLILESSVLLPLLKHLKTYLVSSPATIEVVRQNIVHVVEGTLGEIRFPQPFGYLTLLPLQEKKKNGEESSPAWESISDEEYLRMRLEYTLPVQGIDFHHEMFLDIGREEAISFTKGCYLGQEVMARVHRLGAQRTLARIVYPTRPASFPKVTSHGKEIGEVSSSCSSEFFKGTLCFALIRNSEEIDGGKLVSPQETPQERPNAF